MTKKIIYFMAVYFCFNCLVIGAFGQTTKDSTLYRIFGLDEIAVTATRSPKPISKLPITTRIISAQQIENRGISDIKTLLEQEVPGLTFNQVGFGTNINFQGLSSQHILFLIDGERLAGETGGNIDYERINLSNISQIEIVQGASSALYGSQAMGAVINVITKNATRKFELMIGGRWGQLYDRNYNSISADDPQRFFKLNTDKHNANGDISIGIKRNRFSSFTSLSVKTSDAYQLFDRDSTVKFFPEQELTVFEKRRMTPTNISGFGNINFSQKLSYDVNSKVAIKLNYGYYQKDRYDLIPDNKYEHDRDYNYSTTITYKPNPLSDWIVSYYADSYTRYQKYELLPKEKDLVYRHQYQQPRLIYNNYSYTHHILNAGLEYINESLLTDKFSNINYETRSQKSANLFIQDDWAIKEDISVISGVRLDYNNAYGVHLSPKLSAMYKQFPFTFRFNYAMGFRSPSIKELYMNWNHLGMFTIYGNKNLQPEQNNYLALSGEYVSSYIYLLATTYLNAFQNKIEGVWANNQTELHYQNINHTTLIGASLNLRLKLLKGCFIYSSVNYSQNTRRSEVQLSSIAPWTGNARLEYTFPNTKWGKAIFNLTGAFTGQKQFRVNETLNLNNIETETYYSNTISPYMIWHITFSHYFSNHKLRLTVGVDNVFNFHAPIVSFNSYTGPKRTGYLTAGWEL